MRPRPSARKRSQIHPSGQRGIALLVVLWTVVILSLLAASTLRSSRNELALTRNLIDTIRAEALSDGAVHFAIQALLTDPTGPDALKIDGTLYSWQEQDAELRLRMTSEIGRIDLNAASEDLLAALFAAVGVEHFQARSIADAIADFRDPDDLARPNGAEDADYLEAGRALGSQDSPFTTPEQLRRVLGVTQEIYDQVQPAITVWNGRPTPDPRAAPKLVLSALGAVAEAQRPDEDPGEPEDQPESDAFTNESDVFSGSISRNLQVIEAGSGRNPGIRGFVRIEAGTKLLNGFQYTREAVVLLLGRPNELFRSVRWRRSRVSLFEAEEVPDQPQ
ncbi:MAG: type II secretion system protein GspK [Kiloniellales bacterium]|nr:type II secretion system protein GspK [Kiloniellales bacterium]